MMWNNTLRRFATGFTISLSHLLCCYVALVMSDSVGPHRRQPTRLPHPWNSPGKNTGVGCHFLLQCMKVKSESEVTQSCPTRSNPMDSSLPGSSVRGIFQAGVLEWGAIAFSAEKPRALRIMLNQKKKKKSNAESTLLVLYEWNNKEH